MRCTQEAGSGQKTSWSGFQVGGLVELPQGGGWGVWVGFGPPKQSLSPRGQLVMCGGVVAHTQKRLAGPATGTVPCSTSARRRTKRCTRSAKRSWTPYPPRAISTARRPAATCCAAQQCAGVDLTITFLRCRSFLAFQETFFFFSVINPQSLDFICSFNLSFSFQPTRKVFSIFFFSVSIKTRVKGRWRE